MSAKNDKKLAEDPGQKGLYAVHAGAKQRKLKIKLRDRARDKYDVWKKPIPSDIPSSFVDPDDNTVKQITWLNNFGLKLKGRDQYEDMVDAYQIEINDRGYEVFVYFDGKKVKKFKNFSRGNGTVTLELGIGDPPIGAGGGG